MKTVTIQIEIEVPDDATHAAVDSNGEPYWYEEDPVLSHHCDIWDTTYPSQDNGIVSVINWRDTLTEV